MVQNPHLHRRASQTSAQTIFKPRLITSAPPGGSGKGKSRPYLGLQQLLKWNKKNTLFSYNVLSRQKHINVWMRESDPFFFTHSWTVSSSEVVFTLINKGRYWLSEIYSFLLLSIAKTKQQKRKTCSSQKADTLFWRAAVWWGLCCFAVVHLGEHVNNISCALPDYWCTNNLLSHIMLINTFI